MKAPGEAAMELPWLPPSAGALAALCRPQSAPVWSQIRTDPGCVLLLARVDSHCDGSWTTQLGSLPLLETSLHFLENTAAAFIDWHDQGAAPILIRAQRQAWLASELATRVPGCDAHRAWTGGLLAPLGWLALAALHQHKGA